MNSHLGKRYFTGKSNCYWMLPRIRWQDYFAQWLRGVGLLAVLSWGGLLYATDLTVPPGGEGGEKASGTISDKFTNPLEGVIVQIADQSVATDNNGYWEINNLPEADYTVMFNKEGYTFPSVKCAISNNKDCHSEIVAQSVLEITVVPSSQLLKPGEDITYTIIVTNQGEETATNVVFTDILPVGTHLITIEVPEGGHCDDSTEVSVSCDLPDLTPGATTITAITINNTQAEKLQNTVTTAAEEYPPDIQVTWTKIVPYLSLSISDTPDPVKMQEVLHYAVDVELSSYAPSPATGIELQMTLPSGVELQSLHSDEGTCDMSNLPRVTCSFIDLTIEDNHAKVDVGVKLIDAGLLLLNFEAKLEANEYPTYQVKERTKVFIPEDIEVDMALVIDVSGSMQEEINGVIMALGRFIMGVDPSNSPLMALIVFEDEVKIEAFTSDLKVLLGALENLTVSGGGGCSEASINALNMALLHIKNGGDLLFATDASPYAESDVKGVADLLRSKAIRFNAMITGDCSQESRWDELP